MLTGAYQEINQVIFRAPFSKMTYFWPKIQPFLLPGKPETKTNGPKPVATMSNQTYLPIASDLNA